MVKTGKGTRTKVIVLDTGALNPVVSVRRVEACGWRLEVLGEGGTMSDEPTTGGGSEGEDCDSEDDDGAFGLVRDSEGIGAVDVTGAGGASRDFEEEVSTEEAGVGTDASEVEFMGGAPDTAEVLDGDWEAGMLELSGFRDSDELREAEEVAAVTDDGGVCGASIGVLVRVSEEDGAPVVPSGLSGSLVTVTQSVMDTVLLFKIGILDSSSEVSVE